MSGKMFLKVKENWNVILPCIIGLLGIACFVESIIKDDVTGIVASVGLLICSGIFFFYKKRNN